MRLKNWDRHAQVTHAPEGKTHSRNEYILAYVNWTLRKITWLKICEIQLIYILEWNSKSCMDILQRKSLKSMFFLKLDKIHKGKRKQC